MINIVVNTITPRIQYVFKYLFEAQFEVKYTISTLEDYVLPKNNLTIFYVSDLRKVEVLEGIKIKANSYLYSDVAIAYPNLPNALPELNSITDLLKVDFIALIFYLLSRAEETLPNAVFDNHGRYKATSSILCQWNTLDKPIVDQWVNALGRLFGLSLKCKYKSIPTIDIDTGFKHTYKGFKRTTGGLVKSLIFKPKNALERLQVLLGLKADPYDIYSLRMQEIAKAYKGTKVFILNAEKGKYDSSLPMGGKGLKRITAEVKKVDIELGIHPSYASNNSRQVLEKELSSLRTIAGKIKISRQHFLKLSIPKTYQNLIENDISDDFSMAYPDTPGFRAGTCKPYTFFNIKENKELNLNVHSACFMDGAFFQYQQVSIEEAKSIALLLQQTVKQYQGEFISIWHESTLSNESPWNKVFNTVYPCK